LLKANPTIKILIDIHRDSGLTSREASQVMIDGQQAAKVLLIVGTDTRLPHPQWKENQKFAQMFGEKVNELYPGLLKGVRLQSGRYNQHLHPHALLIEIGSDKNSLDEAERSAVMLARVISEVLKESP
jgi:stage II sporulation protein P